MDSSAANFLVESTHPARHGSSRSFRLFHQAIADALADDRARTADPRYDEAALTTALTVGVKDDGSPDRRHRQARTEAEVIAAVRALERERDAGTVRKAGRAMTVQAWLSHWVENITQLSVKYKSYHAYRTAVEQHLVPGLGLLGVPERAAMEVMGWSHGSMAMRYQHVTAILRQDIAARLDKLSVATRGRFAKPSGRRFAVMVARCKNLGCALATGARSGDRNKDAIKHGTSTRIPTRTAAPEGREQ